MDIFSFILLEGRCFMKKAIIALSGGIDSAVATAIAKSEGYELYFLTVNYGQKNLKKELKNSKKLAKYYGVVEHKIINMKQIYYNHYHCRPKQHPRTNKWDQVAHR